LFGCVTIYLLNATISLLYMKQLYIFIVLLCSASGFCQPVKDSLLEADKQKVSDLLHMANYLDNCALTYFLKPTDEKIKMSFSRFYKEIVVGYNPVPSINISEYLGYKNDVEPINSDAFCDIVSGKNLESLILITETYGYPSFERMRSGGRKDLHSANMICIMRNEDFDKKLKTIFKIENKVGNLSDKEYNHFKFIMKRKKVMTEDDVKWLEKNAGVVMKFNDKLQP